MRENEEEADEDDGDDEEEDDEEEDDEDEEEDDDEEDECEGNGESGGEMEEVEDDEKDEEKEDKKKRGPPRSVQIKKLSNGHLRILDTAAKDFNTITDSATATGKEIAGKQKEIYQAANSGSQQITMY